MTNRPVIITAIGAITIIAAILILAIAAISLFDASLLDKLVGDLDISDWVGYGGIILGIVALIIGVALWRGWSIAWYIAVILYVVYILGSLYSVYQLYTSDASLAAIAAPVVLIIIAIVIVYYLFRPKVKSFFLG